MLCIVSLRLNEFDGFMSSAKMESTAAMQLSPATRSRRVLTFLDMGTQQREQY